MGKDMIPKKEPRALIKRYLTVLKKCHRMHCGSLAAVWMLFMGWAGMAKAESVQTFTINSSSITLAEEFI